MPVFYRNLLRLLSLASINLKPQFYPQISQINADFHAVIRRVCITKKVRTSIEVMAGFNRR
jgi:hypothetical protein